MKKNINRVSILLILTFVFTLTTPITRVSLAESCIPGTEGCPGDIDTGGDGPKSPPPKDTSILCKWLGLCKVG